MISECGIQDKNMKGKGNTDNTNILVSYER